MFKGYEYDQISARRLAIKGQQHAEHLEWTAGLFSLLMLFALGGSGYAFFKGSSLAPLLLVGGLVALVLGWFFEAIGTSVRMQSAALSTAIRREELAIRYEERKRK